MKVAALIPAAGDGKRLKTKKAKAFVEVAGKPLFIHTLLRLQKTFKFQEIILMVSPLCLEEARTLLNRYGLKQVRVVPGGKTRAESVWRGLDSVSPQSDWVLVHDMARPLVSKSLVAALLKAVKKHGAVISALPATDTVKKVRLIDRVIEKTLDRRQLYLAQTPQVFKKTLLKRRYEELGKKAFLRTDEASLFDGSATRVMVVPGEEKNIKITRPGDLGLLKFYLQSEKN